MRRNQQFQFSHDITLSPIVYAKSVNTSIANEVTEKNRRRVADCLPVVNFFNLRNRKFSMNRQIFT
jgi:hypothetical protein